MIIGVVGPIGSGKDLAGRHLKKKYRFKIVSMGNIVRELAQKEGISMTRENLRETQEKYHKKYGNDFVIKKAWEKAGKFKNAVITGIRTPVQARFPKKRGAKIILVDASPEIRFKRIRKRGRANDPQTFKEFQKQEKEEAKFFDLKRTFSYADFKIMNNFGEKELFSEIDRIMKRCKR